MTDRVRSLMPGLLTAVVIALAAAFLVPRTDPAEVRASVPHRAESGALPPP